MPNTSPHIDPRRFLLKLYESAVDAVSAERCLPSYLPRKAPRGRTVVIGAGQGSAALAKVVEDPWPPPSTGLVITPYGHGVYCGLVEVVARLEERRVGTECVRRCISRRWTS